MVTWRRAIRRNLLSAVDVAKAEGEASVLSAKSDYTYFMLIKFSRSSAPFKRHVKFHVSYN